VIIGGNIAPLVESGALPETDRAELVETTAAKFELSTALNWNVERNCYHVSLSLPVYEQLGEGDFSKLADEYLSGLILSSQNPKFLDREAKEIKIEIDKFIESELNSYQYAVVKHNDAEHSHVHIVASRINLETGKAIDRSWDRYRSQKLLRHLEKAYGLEQNQNSWTIPLDQKFPSKSQDDLSNDYAKEIKPQLEQVLKSVKLGQGFNFKGSRYQLRTGKDSILFHQVGRSRALLRLKRDGSCTSSGLKREDVEAIKKTSQQLAAVAQKQAREQAVYANDVALMVQSIWQKETTGRPKLKTFTFKDYLIRMNDKGQPELFKRDIKVMGWANQNYEGYNLSTEDITAVEEANVLSQKRANERLKQQQFDERARQKQRDRQKQKGKGIEMG
jgi:hypothetical protein